MNKNEIFKHLGCILFFLTISVVYFLPKTEGKTLQQGDIQQWEGMSHELHEYFDKEGGVSAWTGSMFSGMPAYSVTYRSHIPNALNYVESIFTALDKNSIGIVFLSLVCMYILLCVLKLPLSVSILGAIAYSFSSYSIIIIAAGHVTKAWAMAYIPLLIAGLVLLNRKKWIMGATLFTFALAAEIKEAHFQITYYVMILCIFLYACYVVNKIKEKDFKTLATATGLLCASVIIATLANSGSLYSNWELSKSSIRGASELTSKVDGKEDKSSGLDMSYAFSWSYGIGETMTLLIPNFYGGESGGALSSKDSHLAKAMKEINYQVPKELHAYTYWGDQPFTSGPVYFGAIICFLFLFSFFVIDSKYKWWILGATVFCIILSWGKNFLAVNEFLFHHMPIYNKFRTPSMALVIPQFTFVLMACIALKKISQVQIDKKQLVKFEYIAAGITAGICLILWIFPSLFLDFSCENDVKNNLPEWYINAIAMDREQLLASDAKRSFFFILIAHVLIYFMIKKDNSKYILPALAVLVFVDLWSVDKRYLNEDDFDKERKRKTFVPTTADKAILEDKDPSYRVLTLNNPFNETHVSYYHKSIGGYNAAKLRRYQDLIDQRIEPEMNFVIKALSKVKTSAELDSIFMSTPSLDMLNMRYLIYNYNAEPILNTKANGNAWFVNEIKTVESADYEMLSLSSIDPKRTAVVNKKFGIEDAEFQKDSTASIVMTEYHPDKVTYESTSSKDGVALFSEIYYQPGWSAKIDGKETDHFCANWILRGLKVPQGKHTIEFSFYPKTYWGLRWVECFTTFIIVLLLIGACILTYRERQTADISLAKEQSARKK